jgi:hypothetical protein
VSDALLEVEKFKNLFFYNPEYYIEGLYKGLHIVISKTHDYYRGIIYNIFLKTKDNLHFLFDVPSLPNGEVNWFTLYEFTEEWLKIKEEWKKIEERDQLHEYNR